MGELQHFQTGTMGWLARFFSARKTSGDLYDETVVIPAVIIVIISRLSDLKRIDDWLAVTIFVVTGLVAGVLLGTRFGGAGGLRALLRGATAGAIAAAGYAALSQTIDRQRALTIAGELIYLYGTLFWFGYLPVGMLRDIALISESQWQKAAPRRAWMQRLLRIAPRNGKEIQDAPASTRNDALVSEAPLHKTDSRRGQMHRLLRLALNDGEEVKTAATGTWIAAKMALWLCLALISCVITWTLFNISPLDYFQNQFRH